MCRTNGASFGRNGLLRNDLRLHLGSRFDNDVYICDTEFSHAVSGFRIFDNIRICNNVDVTTLNLDVNLDGLFAFA
jgi:hypothetical protein